MTRHYDTRMKKRSILKFKKEARQKKLQHEKEVADKKK